MSRRILGIVLVTTLPLALLFTSCTPSPPSDEYSLDVQAQGLVTNESIVVSDGTTLEITGTSDLSWTEAQKFDRRYPQSDAKYSVSITQQPTNSNKICRVLNPQGKVTRSTNLVRVECGYPLVISDINNSMTAKNGLSISNGYETLALNQNTLLVTSLRHERVEVPDSNVDILEVSPIRTPSVKFEKQLYLEGETPKISHSSVDQGCEIEGANANSSLDYEVPADIDISLTVKTLPLNEDWIAPGAAFSEGRSCKDFPFGPRYLLDFACEKNENGECIETESGPLETVYTAACYPATIGITCGRALKLSVTGLGSNETLSATATRQPSGLQITHTQEFTADGGKTFNLAFENEEEYEITIISSTTSCVLDPNSEYPLSGTMPPSPGDNIRVTVECTPIP